MITGYPAKIMQSQSAQTFDFTKKNRQIKKDLKYYLSAMSIRTT